MALDHTMRSISSNVVNGCAKMKQLAGYIPELGRGWLWCASPINFRSE